MDKRAGYNITRIEYGAATSVTLDEARVGWKLDGVNRDHQVSLAGLDGGTFSVYGRVPGESTWKTLVTGQAETVAYKVQGYLLEALKVELAGMGAGKAPVLTLVSLPRGI